MLKSGIKSEKPELAFVETAEQAESIRALWESCVARRIVICIDEGTFSPAQATEAFGSGVEVIGRSNLNLDPSRIFQEAVAVSDDLFPADDRSWAGRIEYWRLDAHRRWLLFAIHSARLINTGLERFQPERVWIPNVHPLSLSTRFDEVQDNPLFFDLLAILCSQAMIAVVPARRRNIAWLRRFMLPWKYVIGQWVASLRRPKIRQKELLVRPILINNLHSDFHRQFDLARLGPTATLMHAWLRENEGIAPVDQVLGRIGTPKTSKFDWIDPSSIEDLCTPSGASIRWWSGILYLFRRAWYRMRKQRVRGLLKEKYGQPWWDLLYGSRLPLIYGECQLAAGFFCNFEYERARSVFRKMHPQLFVTSSEHWGFRPMTEAARDLGITTFATTGGVNFMDDMVPREADYVCINGQVELNRLSGRAGGTRYIQAGDMMMSWRQRSQSPMRHEGSRRILIATSGRITSWWWGSLLFDYPAMVRSFEELARALRDRQCAAQLVIKSHPVSDLHRLYDSLVERFRDIYVLHRCKPNMTESEVAGFDAAVAFSTASTFTVEIIRAGVPLIYYRGGLTELGRTQFYHQHMLSADTPAELADLIGRLADGDAALRTEALERADRFLSSCLSEDRRPFNSVVQQILPSSASAQLVG